MHGNSRSMYVFAMAVLLVGVLAVPGVAAGSIRTLDATGTVGQYSSVQFDATAGVAVVSYYDTTANALKVARCNDATCSAPTITQVVAGGGTWTSLQLDASGFPVIAYVAGAAVRLVHCGNGTCTAGNTDNVVASGLTSPAFVSMRLTAAGNPVVAYHNQGASGSLNVAICADAACAAQVASSPFQLAGPGAGDGRNASLDLDASDRPVVGFGEQISAGPPAAHDLRVARCVDAACSSFSVNTVEAGVLGNASDATSVTLDGNGFPVISYYDPTPSPSSLKVAHCSTVDCSGTATITTVDRGSTVTASWSSIELNPVTGFPLVSYWRAPGNTLALAACADADCASSAISVLDNTVAGSASLTTSLAVTATGSVYVSFYQANAGAAGSNDLRLYFNEGYVVDLGSPIAAEAGGTISFTPTLNAAAPVGGLVVNYTTAFRHSDTAVAADFTTTAGSVSFAAGATVASSAIVVPVTVDALVETPETLSVIVQPTSPIGDIRAYGVNGTWTITDAPPPANLGVILADAPDPVSAGAALTYTAIVTNAGPGDATDVSVSLPLPTGTTFASADPGAGGSCVDPGVGANGTVTCTWTGTTVNGGSRTATIVATVLPSTAGVLSATATTTASTTDPTPGDDASTQDTTVSASADLSIVLTSAPDPATAGSNLTYTATVSNGGPSDALGVTVSLTLPAGTAFVSATPSAGGTCNAISPVVCTWAGPFAPGAGPVVTVVAAIGVSTPGPLSASATVSSLTSDPNPANDSSIDLTDVLASPYLTSIPALGGHGLLLLGTLLALGGFLVARRHP